MSEGDDYLFAVMLHAQLNAEEEQNNSSVAAEQNKESDYELARKLQALLDEENDAEEGDVDGASDLDTSLQFVYPSNQNQSKSNTMGNKKTAKGADAPKKPPVRAIQASHDDYLNQTQNLVHPQWELVDPTPDIYSMFIRFDEKFFQQRLGAVALEWSKRMYSCAGICYQRGNRFVKEVTIRLSEPLLKLRPRKDLVETLLHEMIHAYCFVLNIREGNGGHGPNFKRIMETINKVAGTNITVYHSFHDEVNAYRTHIWRCTGICQNRTPFQGYVKRTSNRAPGPSDQWWAKHQRECGGTFMKLGEPSKPPKPEPKSRAKKVVKPEAAPKDDIRNWLGKPAAKKPPTAGTSLGEPAAKKAATNAALLGNLVGAVPPTSYPGLSSDPFAMPKPPAAAKPSGANIMSFGDLNTSDEENAPTGSGSRSKATAEMGGQGYSVGGTYAHPITNDNSPDPSRLRQIRLERFGKGKSTKENDTSQPENAQKRRRVSSDTEIVTWESYDDDVMVADVAMPVIDLADSDSDEEQPANDQSFRAGARNTMSSAERTQCIKREVFEDETIFSEDDILFIDDEYDDEEAATNNSFTAATELADQSIIDDFFGEDTLLQEFQRENSVQPSCSNYSNNVDNDIVSCPICFEKMKRTQLANHFEGCTITVRVEPPSFKPKGVRTNADSTGRDLASSASTSKFSSSRGSKTKSQTSKQILRNSGYTDKEIAELNLSSSSDSTTVLSSEDELTPRQRRQRNLFKQTVGCPKCGQELMGHQLEAHRSLCQSKKKR
ncbi:uncharacterized protein LOC108026610 isoform X2 [Drosophila biarmipes]|uniref:uncharacterized protein LOC108026610 isoform X2 n=1 Tax=Drosophila biarmipes TaxID=125945 RepID=UPI0007E809C9|nr:uncharacterized protein LOC108026610 isoform X2 [Drosophila biarmipes]